MNSSLRLTSSRSLWAGLACLVGVGLATPALAEDLQIDARLIWATNDEKSPDPSHKAVQGALAKELQSIFKWKNYFEVKRQTGTVPSRQTRQFKMSKQCVIEITELEGPKVEVKLIGEGKPVNKTIKPLSRGEHFTIGGDDKNGCAWFVIVTQVAEKKTPAPEKPKSEKPDEAKPKAAAESADKEAKDKPPATNAPAAAAGK